MAIIRPYIQSDEHSWDRYVDYHPDGTIFHLTAWKKVVELSFAHDSYYLIAERDGAVSGVLPLFRIKSFLFGHYLVSAPFAELGGPLADSPEVASELVAHAAALSEELGCDYVEFRNRNSLPHLPVKSLYYNFSRQIYPNEDENLMAIPRKSRAAVRQGIKSRLSARFGKEQLPEFYEILARSYHSLGTPVFPLSFFRNLLKCYGERAEIEVVRTTEGLAIAAVLSFFYKDRVIPYYAGSLRDHRHLAPNDYQYWELMKWGCEQGYRIFDFGRSKEGTGSFDFKRHWGFEPVPLAYQYHLRKADEMPNLSPANPKYKRKIEMWQRLPFPMTKLLGPMVARHLA